MINYADENMAKAYFDKYDCDDIVRLDQTYERPIPKLHVYDEKDMDGLKKIIRVIAKEKRIDIEILEKRTKLSFVRLNRELKALEKVGIVNLDRTDICLTNSVWNMTEKEIVLYMYNRL